jgi:hypothetical protein
MMGLEEIDRVLAWWDERLRRIDESLLALEAEPTYQMLAPRSATRATLEGETARVVGPALDAMGELFEHRGRLTEVLDRARAVRASITFWGGGDKEQEIRALLEGPSIELPTEATPLARRALLDPGSREVRVVPGQLLEAMSTAFTRARDAVVAAQQAWELVEPQIATIERKLGDARTSAASLGVEGAVREELAVVERELEVARKRIARDPLGASGDLGAHLVPRIAAVTDQLAGLAAQRARVEDGIAGARDTLRELHEIHARARAAIDALPREIEGARAPGRPTDDGHIEGLGPWLDKIRDAASAGRWSTGEVGLARWNDAAKGYLAADGQIARALSSVLARREELSGRLSARRAQVAALVARGVSLDPSAEDAAREAEKLLARRPTPLARAAELVERFDAAVRARSKG